MSIREIHKSDYYKDYMKLINNFTKNPVTITYDNFCAAIDTIRQQNGHIFVIEDSEKIIGTVKILIEQKLHNNLKSIGHIEDLVIGEESRKNGYGMLLVNYCIDICKLNNCYKVVLGCNPTNIDFYKKSGFIEKGIEMTIYL